MAKTKKTKDATTENMITKTIRYTFYFDESKSPEKTVYGLIDPSKNDPNKVALKELYSVDVKFTEKPEMFNNPQFEIAVLAQVDNLFHTFFKCSLAEVHPEEEKSNIIIP